MSKALNSKKTKERRKFLGSIFSKEEQAISLIGEGLSVEGTLNFEEGVLRLEGRMEGKIIGRGTLIIGEKGLLQGEIQVNRLVLSGRFEGAAATSEYAHIAPTGKFFGKVRTSQLIIDEGGILEGESQFLPPQEAAPRVS